MKGALASLLLLAAMPVRAQSDGQHVIAQLCFPKQASANSSWLRVDEVGRQSISAVQAIEAGLTTGEQRVVELVLSEPGYPRHLILSLDPTAAMVFVMPGRFASGEWSPWRPADFQSAHSELQFFLLSDQRVPDRSAAPEAAPRIRFRVMSYEQYREHARLRREQALPHDLPAC